MHPIKQNSINNMESPPYTERDFVRLVKEHSRIINKVCYFYSSEKLPFEDLRQDVYINIWQGLQYFRGESKFSTWIYRVAVNSALMAIRTSKNRPETETIDLSSFNLTTEIDDVQKENLQMLYDLINRLEDLEKAIILLWLDEHSYDDIAEILDLKRNTVATKIRRIKEKLSKQI